MALGILYAKGAVEDKAYIACELHSTDLGD